MNTYIVQTNKSGEGGAHAPPSEDTRGQCK